jgi:hypothetical protein
MSEQSGREIRSKEGVLFRTENGNGELSVGEAT